ncbi:RRXRR domain-containing protein [Streptosporangium sp. OZ121]|uniref:RRXRR domain-containing protein n=1 Tax=Streptosporangium sp. OZ121 TaxID=3444183 RepID=UPI003F7AFEFF
MFVLDTHGQPLDPCHPARARRLPASGRAVVHRHTPFVIRLRGRAVADSTIQGVEVGIDPGSKHTGIAVFTERDGIRTGTYGIQLDHRGGSERIGNLTLACVPCNQAKNATSIQEFLKAKPALLAKILRMTKAPLRDAAAVNATRWALWRALSATTLPVSTASGGRTKWNRTRTGAPKSHTLDALHVGAMEAVIDWPSRVLVVKATGRGTYCRTCTDKYVFPRLRLPRIKTVRGFQTGDLVRANVPTGKKAGVHTGRVAVRSTGNFDFTTRHGTVQGIGHRHVHLLQRADGYGYTLRSEAWPRAAFPPPPEGVGIHAGEI